MLVKIFVILAPVVAWAEDSQRSHEVANGETLGGILIHHGFRNLWCTGCAVEQVAELNSLSNPNFLKIGQILILSREENRPASPIATKEELKRTDIAQPTESPVLEAPASEVVVSESTVDEEKVSRATANEDVIRSEIIVAIPLHFVGLEGVDRGDQTRGTLLTNLSPGLLLGWRLNLTPQWQSEISARIEQDHVQPDINLNNIENREQSLSELDLHVRYGSLIRLALDLKTRDRLVYRAATGPGIRVQTVPVTSAGLSLDAVLVRISSASLLARLGAETIFASSQVETGLAMNGRLILRQDFERWALEAEIGYESSSYKTTLVELTGSDLWLTWGIVWKL